MSDYEMMFGHRLNLQRFAEAGTLLNATNGYPNAYTGEREEFSGKYDLSAGMKTFHRTQMLENMRSKQIYGQLGLDQTLPDHNGKSVEWRKNNTLPDADVLEEGVIPKGKKWGQSSIRVDIVQIGLYAAYTDQIETHHIDPVISGLSEEVSAAMSRTAEKMIRNELSGNTNVLMARVIGEDGKVESQPTTREQLKTALNAGKKANLTPFLVGKAAAILNKADTPKFNGREYVGVIHESTNFDLMNDPNWVDWQKYSNPQAMFEGEVGKIFNVRFVATNNAPIIRAEGDAQAIYQTMIFGKDAFAVVKPEGAGLELIHHGKDKAGGPLNQFGTIGGKMSFATKILYPERMIIIEHGNETFGADDKDNMELEYEAA